jgi:hypothetical protein
MSAPQISPETSAAQHTFCAFIPDGTVAGWLVQQKIDAVPARICISGAIIDSVASETVPISITPFVNATFIASQLLSFPGFDVFEVPLSLIPDTVIQFRDQRGQRQGRALRDAIFVQVDAEPGKAELEVPNALPNGAAAEYSVIETHAAHYVTVREDLGALFAASRPLADASVEPDTEAAESGAELRRDIDTFVVDGHVVSGGYDPAGTFHMPSMDGGITTNGQPCRISGIAITDSAISILQQRECIEPFKLLSG